MAQARSTVMPAGARGTYHVVTRCALREFRLGGEHAHRREWAARMLAELLRSFAVDLQAYAILSNHLHLVLRPRPDVAAEWNPVEVARRSLRAIPVRTGIGMTTLPLTPESVERYASDGDWVSEQRQRLSSLMWLMRLFKQRLARRANAETGVIGHFWESRYLTVPLLDVGAVFACMAYVDRNPLRAGVVTTLAQATYTSIAHRMAAGGLCDLGEDFSEADRLLARQLLPLGRCAPVDPRSGEIPARGLDLTDYLQLVEAPLAAGRLETVCQGLGIDAARWRERVGNGGLFQGVAVGPRSARAAFAATQGKRILADRTGIWS